MLVKNATKYGPEQLRLACGISRSVATGHKADRHANWQRPHLRCLPVKQGEHVGLVANPTIAADAPILAKCLSRSPTPEKVVEILLYTFGVGNDLVNPPPGAETSKSDRVAGGLEARETKSHTQRGSADAASGFKDALSILEEGRPSDLWVIAWSKRQSHPLGMRVRRGKVRTLVKNPTSRGSGRVCRVCQFSQR